MYRFAYIICAIILTTVGLAACQDVNSSDAPTANLGDTPVIVTSEVEVTREVVVTVNVPFEVTRQVYVQVPAETVASAGGAVEEAVVGSAEMPIRLLFSPIYSDQVTQLRAQHLADALSAETGLSFTIDLAATHAATIEAACDNPSAIVAFLTSLEYVLANNRCGLQQSFAGVRDGIPWVTSMIMVRGAETVDDRVDSLDDLAGRSWGVGSTDDLTNYLYFKAFFQSQGIEVGPVTEYETDARTVIAGFDGREGFVTATYLPPLLPYNSRLWEFGVDDPEIWTETGEMPRRSGIGYAIVDEYVDDGGYQVRDARAIVLDARPTVFVYSDLITLGEQMPNDAVGFGAHFPLQTARQVEAVLLRYAASEQCVESLCSDDFFNWEAVAPVDDDFYDSVRFVIDQLALTDQQIFDLLSNQAQ